MPALSTPKLLPSDWLVKLPVPARAVASKWSESGSAPLSGLMACAASSGPSENLTLAEGLLAILCPSPWYRQD